jgi:GDP-L-fucose synthase
MKLLTGGNGFIGSNISSDVKLSRFDCDLTDYNSVIQSFKKYSPTTVIHTASKHGSAVEMLKNHSQYIENNIISDLNIIKACRETGVENLLMLSTITSFDPNHPSPFTEKSIHGEVNENIFGYAYSKKICVGLCKAYQLDYDLNYKSIYLGNTYGPYGKFHQDGTVIHNLIYRFYKAIQENTDVHLYGNGKVFRNYLYVEDLNQILDEIIFNKDIKDPIIVSSDKSISILDIVDAIMENLDFKNNVIFDSNKVIGEQVKIVDNTKLKSIIGDFTFTDLRMGIKKTIDWYKNTIKIDI